MNRPPAVDQIVLTVQDKFPQANFLPICPPINPDGVWSVDVDIGESEFTIEYWQTVRPKKSLV